MPQELPRKSCDVGLQCGKSACFSISSGAKCRRFELSLQSGLRCECRRCQIASNVGRAMRATKHDRKCQPFLCPMRFQPSLSQRTAKGAGGKGPRQKTSKIVKKVSKIFSTLFDICRAGQKKSKIVKKCQKVFRHISTIFALHHFSGPVWGALIIWAHRRFFFRVRKKGSFGKGVFSNVHFLETLE